MEIVDKIRSIQTLQDSPPSQLLDQTQTAFENLDSRSGTIVASSLQIATLLPFLVLDHQSPQPDLLPADAFIPRHRSLHYPTPNSVSAQQWRL